MYIVKKITTLSKSYVNEFFPVEGSGPPGGICLATTGKISSPQEPFAKQHMPGA